MTTDDDVPETLPAPARPRTEIATFDPQRRYLDMTEREVVALAERWWDRTGRRLMRHPDLRNPDVGVASGILRGLRWSQLNARERQQVILAYHQHYLLPKLAAWPSPVRPGR